MKSFKVIALIALLTGCSSSLDIPYKGPELNSLEQTANYFQARNVAKKLKESKIKISERAFMLGAYDLRDGIAPRIPESSYADLLNMAQKNASPLLSVPLKPEIDPNAPDGLQSLEDRISYLTARAVAKGFGKNGIPIMPASMMIGVNDAQSSTAPKINSKEEKKLLEAIQDKIHSTDNDWAENRKQYYQAEERTFFADNIVKPDVIALPSGVQYKFIVKGTGKTPKIKDTVTVMYKGTLLDGTEFDSSYQRGSSDNFKLSDMIPGFSQAMTQVPDGSKVVIYIPALQAYGEKGAPGVPPHAAIKFEVELKGVKSGFF